MVSQTTGKNGDPVCFQRKKEQITKKDKDAKWLWTSQEQYWRLKCNGPCLHFSEEELFSTLNSVSSQTTKQIQRQIKAFQNTKVSKKLLLVVFQKILLEWYSTDIYRWNDMFWICFKIIHFGRVCIGRNGGLGEEYR